MIADDVPRPLDGLEVVEIAEMESIQYAGRTLAQLGANVTRIEPADGGTLGSRPPFLAVGSGERSVPHEYFCMGKTVLQLGGEQLPTAADAAALAGGARVLLIEDAAVRDLDLELPPRMSPQLRVRAGLYGMRSVPEPPSSALTRFHASINGYIVPADLDMNARPGWTGPYIFESIHGVGMTVSILSELTRPEGGEVDFSVQAYGLWLEKLLFARTTVYGTEFHRDNAAYSFGGFIECRDGYVAMFVIEEHQWVGFCSMVGKQEWLSDPRFKDGLTRSKNAAVIREALADWCLDHSVEEVLADAARLDVPLGRTRSPDDLLATEQLSDRGFFGDPVDTPFGAHRLSGLPFGPSFPSRPPEGTVRR